MKLVKQLLKSWKVGKCSELKLICEDGVIKVTMSANLGTWVQPIPKVTSDRGYQGSRRRASPSYLRRQERRAAERAANSPAPTAAAAEQAPAAAKPGRICQKCSKPCLGHKGPTGEKCASTPPSPEKVRESSPALYLQVTPFREGRVEDFQNSGAVMLPDHQCDETEIVSESEVESKIKKSDKTKESSAESFEEEVVYKRCARHCDMLICDNTNTLCTKCRTTVTKSQSRRNSPKN